MVREIKINEISSVFTDQIDLFICNSSFEKRCKVIPREIAEIKPLRSIVFYNNDFSEKIKKNAKYLYKLFGKNRCVKVETSLNDSLFSYLNIFNVLSIELNNLETKNIVIDITTFTHESLLLVLKALVSLKKDDQNLKFVYNAAKSYSCNEIDIEKKWLTKGIKFSRTIIGYPGITDLTLNDHLIILFGFEKDRTNRVIKDFEYNKITLAFGKEGSSIKESHYIINKKRHKELIDLYRNTNQLEVTLNDPDFIKEEIKEYIETLSENIVIMPMNNKLSTLGVGLAAIENEKIQLYYSLASRYNTEAYSKPSKKVYYYEL